MQLKTGLVSLLFIAGCASNGYAISDKSTESEDNFVYLNCNEFITFSVDYNPNDTVQKREGSTPFAERIVPKDKTVCTPRYSGICANFDTGMRCIKAPCSGASIWIDYENECEACRVIQISGFYNKSCQEVPAE